MASNSMQDGYNDELYGFLTEHDEDEVTIRPNGMDIEIATQIEIGVDPKKLTEGMPVTVSINRRTMDRKYIDRVFYVMSVTENNILLREGWIPGQMGMSYLLTMAEYAFYDARPLVDAVTK
ncbi:hypothetical protein [Neorhizobium sp. DAR64861/K0K2]|uniref:hypothetical protein n=1 Tax=unclassified Neorhizobium TaxID=2629175 RepID=UPI003D2CEE70